MTSLKRLGTHNLKSNDSKLVNVPNRLNNSKYEDKAFVNAATKLWNELHTVRSAKCSIITNFQKETQDSFI